MGHVLPFRVDRVAATFESGEAPIAPTPRSNPWFWAGGVRSAVRRGPARDGASNRRQHAWQIGTQPRPVGSRSTPYAAWGNQSRSSVLTALSNVTNQTSGVP